MKRYILTGAPGAGKTSIIRLLKARGQVVVEEAATDVNALSHARGVARPHLEPDFIDDIVRLQQRRRAAATAGEVQFHDRSPICTYALSVFLNIPISPLLAREMEAIEHGRVYQPTVLFIDNQGFITPTEVRRITYEDTLKFGVVHEQVYRDLGYALIKIAPGPLEARVLAVEGATQA